MLEQVLATIESRKHQSVSALCELLRIPSVSTNPEHKGDMLKCATWLSDKLRYAGLECAILPTAGHPVVVAKNRHEPGRKTVLVYGHYDVQPPEPLEQWKSPPFEPTIRKDDNGFDAVFARGAVDDKGQTWAHIEAITAWQAHGGLPVNLTMVIEGEEEIGSLHLAGFFRRYKDSLAADICVVSDTNQFARGIPAITYGLRGLAYMEVTLTCTSHDLHSGLYGGAVPNAANVLCELLASLHDKDGRVNIPGFYDDVAPLTSAEREMWNKLPYDIEALKRELKLIDIFGEESYSTLERCWARPTCDINGLSAGYQGPGAKTVIGATASAKVSMRLVPHQSGEKIVKLFENALRQRCPKHTKIDVHCHSHTDPVLIRFDSRPTQLAAGAIETGFGVPPTFIRSGGSIPIVATVKQVLGIDTLLIGFGLNDDRVHSPNEKFDLDSLHKGTRTCAALYQQLSKL